jgi:fructose-1,6-bisphosphatase/inositol monophosphatase family enzyme
VTKHPWDVAAIKIIVEEAGGKCTDLDGNDQKYDKDVNGFIASNGFVHDELLTLIKNCRL